MELALILYLIHVMRQKGLFTDAEWARIEPTLRQGGNPWETVAVLSEIVSKEVGK